MILTSASAAGCTDVASALRGLRTGPDLAGDEARAHPLDHRAHHVARAPLRGLVDRERDRRVGDRAGEGERLRGQRRVERMLIGQPSHRHDDRPPGTRDRERRLARGPERGPDLVGEPGQRVGALRRATERRVRPGLAAPAATSLLHTLVVEERGALEVDADEHTSRRRPRERHLPRVERVPGEEPGVLLREAAHRARDRRRAGHGRAPGAAVERVVGLHGARERDRELVVTDQARDRRVGLPRPGLHRAAGGGEPDPPARVGEHERGECGPFGVDRGDRAERRRPRGPAVPPSTGSSRAAPPSVPRPGGSSEHQSGPQDMAAEARQHAARPPRERRPTARRPRSRRPRSAGSGSGCSRRRSRAR